MVIEDLQHHFYILTWCPALSQIYNFQMAQYANPNQFGAPMGDNGYMEQVRSE